MFEPLMYKRAISIFSPSSAILFLGSWMKKNSCRCHSLKCFLSPLNSDGSLIWERSLLDTVVVLIVEAGMGDCNGGLGVTGRVRVKLDGMVDGIGVSLAESLDQGDPDCGGVVARDMGL